MHLTVPRMLAKRKSWQSSFVSKSLRKIDFIDRHKIIRARSSFKQSIHSSLINDRIGFQAKKSQRRKRGGTVIENQSPSSLGANGNQTEGMHFGVTFPDSHAEIRGSRSQFGTRPWDNGGGTITPTSAFTPDLNR